MEKQSPVFHAIMCKERSKSDGCTEVPELVSGYSAGLFSETAVKTG